jgi:putative pyruvate formate lyase activating enzyme
MENRNSRDIWVRVESMLSACMLCPHQCGVNRLAGETGRCRAGRLTRVALASLHHWEEPCISGERGSGTVFFAGCNLTCCYCQNQRISQQDFGACVSIERLAEIFLAQQTQGAHNLNLVTPTPYVPQIIAALELARKAGLTLPVVYNSSAYESPETIQALRGWVDIYLPDLKYCSDELAVSLSGAPGYFSHAIKAIDLMRSQVGDCEFDEAGLLKRGVLIRHLALPGQAEDSRRILAAIRDIFGKDSWFSLMNQYTPPVNAAMPFELDRRLTEEEYEELIDFALSLGMENGFIQEAGTASEKFIPDFNLDGITHRGASS